MNIILFLIIIPIISLVIELLTSKTYSIAISSISAFMMLILSSYVLATGFISKNIMIYESYAYMPILNVSFSFYIGIIPLVLLIMASIVLLVASMSGNINSEKQKLSSAFLILFQIAATGLFTASNLFVFFIFWDIGVITAFAMINTLGYASSKIASINFLIYEIFASVMLLFAILLIYFYTPLHTFNIQSIISGSAQIPVSIQALIFFFMLIAFMVNMPLFPFHSWLPGAYSEASTQGSMVIGGILSKFGALGMLLMFEMLPIATHYSIYVAAIAIISSVYGALVLASQHDIKRIVAYVAMVEMGIVALGISASNTIGSYGALYGMLAQGLAIAFMFLVAGSIMHEFGERDIRLLKGIIASSKSSAYSFVMGTFAISGLPLTAGFIADILIFIGAYKSFALYGLLPLFAIALTASYLYYIINKSVLESTYKVQSVSYIGSAQKIGYAIFIAALFIFGVMPFLILSMAH